jgi:hypothetical protein
MNPRRPSRPGRVLGLLIAGALFGLAGCGVGANSTPASLPVASVGPSATVGPAVAQTRGAIVSALSNVAVQFGDATRPYRPAESARLRNAPRAVYQVVLPDRPDAGFIVVYEFADAAAAVDAGNEEAGYLGTGPGRVQFPLDEQHVLRQLGPTLIVYSWSPSASSGSTAADVGAALNTIGIGFSVPR